jgi:NADH-quinone oxidoreductase subunit C
MLNVSQIHQIVDQAIPHAKASILTSEHGHSSLLISSESLLEVCSLLKSHASLDFNVLQVITGTDYPQENYIEVSYIFANFGSLKHQIILKVRVSRSIDPLPQLPTLSHLWSAANWQERECYDMLGVEFKNHPDHRRILCGDDWEGYPLRKDYVASQTYQGLDIYPDHKMNWEDRKFAEKNQIESPSTDQEQ